MPSTAATAPRRIARSAGAALVSAALTSVIAEAIAGNGLAVVTGLSGRALGLPRWLAIAGPALGGVGLLNIPLTYGWTPTGLAERISLYSYLLWALLTGLELVRPARRTV